jgi:adenylosuccinate synthase
MISFYDVNIQYNLDERENFLIYRRIKKLDFIDSEEYLHQAQKRVSQYYVKEPKVLYWM